LVTIWLACVTYSTEDDDTVADEKQAKDITLHSTEEKAREYADRWSRLEPESFVKYDIMQRRVDDYDEWKSLAEMELDSWYRQ
jgi:hypothetical protein